MLEANREMRCADKVPYRSEEEAKKVPGQMGLSWESTQKYRATQCPDCEFWHLLHISESVRGI
jgi:DNA-directed RNA polymerase subunit RPC12/RpoP